MALETLAHRKMIDGFHVSHKHHKDDLVEDERCINIDHDQNSIKFIIQNGPVKEAGLNGCQLDTLIETAKIMLEGLDDKIPSDWNLKAIQSLNNALECLRLRKHSKGSRMDKPEMNKYRKKPVVIEAMQWDGTEESAQKILKWANARWLYVPILQEKHKLISKMIIPTLEGRHNAIPGDFIIKGVKGEFYPCKPDIFERTYEKV